MCEERVVAFFWVGVLRWVFGVWDPPRAFWVTQFSRTSAIIFVRSVVQFHAILTGSPREIDPEIV